MKKIKRFIENKINIGGLKKFAVIIDPFIERQFLMSKERESLKSLRNILLPKLVSGELRISDAEKMIEEAGI